MLVFGDEATINTCMANVLGAGAHNQFSILDMFNCSNHCDNWKKKDISYIANMLLPIIKKLKNMTDAHVSFVFSSLPVWVPLTHVQLFVCYQ